MKIDRLALTCTTLGLGLLAGLTAGCSTKPTPRISHAPTYSYLQDPEALAEIELWPAEARGEVSLIAARDDR